MGAAFETGVAGYHIVASFPERTKVASLKLDPGRYVLLGNGTLNTNLPGQPRAAVDCSLSVRYEHEDHFFGNGWEGDGKRIWLITRGTVAYSLTSVVEIPSSDDPRALMPVASILCNVRIDENGLGAIHDQGKIVAIRIAT